MSDNAFAFKCPHCGIEIENPRDICPNCRGDISKQRKDHAAGNVLLFIGCFGGYFLWEFLVKIGIEPGTAGWTAAGITMVSIFFMVRWWDKRSNQSGSND